MLHLVNTISNSRAKAYLWQLSSEGYLYEIEVLCKDTGEELHKEIVQDSYLEAEQIAIDFLRVEQYTQDLEIFEA